MARTENLPDEQFRKLHGAIRGLKRLHPIEHLPAMENQYANNFAWEMETRPQLESVRHLGVELRAGSQVRLWPKQNSDIIDLALAGKVATIEAIEQDYEERVHLAVTIDDDPGNDLGRQRQIGHRFFFSLEEVEPISLPDNKPQD